MIRTFTTIAAFAAFAAPAAFANTGKAIDACEAALSAESDAKFTGAEFDFRSIKGGSAKKLRFTMDYAGESDSVVCKYKRGEVSEIEWPEAFVQLAEAETVETQ